MNKEKREEVKEYWKDMIYTKGKLDENKVLTELSDYSFILEQVPLVYDAITNGLLSKPNYYASVVITEFEENFWDKNIITDDITQMIKLSKTLEELKTKLKNYLI